MEVKETRTIDALAGLIPKMNPWEKKFMKSMVEASKKDWNLSDARIKKLQEIQEKYIGDNEDERTSGTDTMEFGNITAKKGDEGWRIEIDGRVVGKVMGKAEAETVCRWLEKSWPTLSMFAQTEEGAYDPERSDRSIEEDIADDERREIADDEEVDDSFDTEELEEEDDDEEEEW